VSTSASFPVGLKKAAVLCILRSPAGLLLVRRTKEPHLDKYIPIGGKLDPFEAPEDTAKREIAEETGLQVDQVKHCGVMTETSPTSFNWISYIYSADVEETEPIECKEGVLEWVPDERLERIPTPETDLHIYRAVAEERFFVFNAIYDENIKLLKLTDDLTGARLVTAGEAVAASPG
jgi:8-oxo-dGTP diphosphatase